MNIIDIPTSIFMSLFPTQQVQTRQTYETFSGKGMQKKEKWTWLKLSEMPASKKKGVLSIKNLGLQHKSLSFKYWGSIMIKNLQAGYQDELLYCRLLVHIQSQDHIGLLSIGSYRRRSEYNETEEAGKKKN